MLKLSKNPILQAQVGNVALLVPVIQTVQLVEDVSHWVHGYTQMGLRKKIEII